MKGISLEEVQAKSARNKAAWKSEPTPAQVQAAKRKPRITSNQKAKLARAGVKVVMRAPLEHEEQCAVIAWSNVHPVIKGRLFAIPNGGKRHKKTAVDLKREGVRAGMLDLMLPIPRDGFHGLFIEMKRTKGSTVSDEQTSWINFLHSQGYCVFIAKGAEEAIRFITAYLE